jgi:hypothetical protein
LLCKKVKVKLSLCFNWAPRHEGVSEEQRYRSTHSLTSAVDGGEWSASGTSRFIARKRVRGTHWIGGWVGFHNSSLRSKYSHNLFFDQGRTLHFAPIRNDSVHSQSLVFCYFYVHCCCRIGSPPYLTGQLKLLCTASRTALGPTQPPIQWVPAALSLG